LQENTYTKHVALVCSDKVMIPSFSDGEMGKNLIIYSGKYVKFVMRIYPENKYINI
jgi:hypothetical protein